MRADASGLRTRYDVLKKGKSADEETNQIEETHTEPVRYQKEEFGGDNRRTELLAPSLPRPLAFFGMRIQMHVVARRARIRASIDTKVLA